MLEKSGYARFFLLKRLEDNLKNLSLLLSTGHSFNANLIIRKNYRIIKVLSKYPIPDDENRIILERCFILSRQAEEYLEKEKLEIKEELNFLEVRRQLRRWKRHG